MMVFLKRLATVNLLIVLCCSWSTAQTTPIDSLRKLYKTAIDNNRKLELAIQILDAQFKSGHHHNALELEKEALALAQSLDDQAARGKIKSRMGTILSNMSGASNELLAIERLKEAEQIFLDLNDKYWLGIVYNNLGNAYAHLGYDSRAFNYYMQNLELSKEIGDKVGEGFALKNIGILYEYQGWHKKALSFHQRALAIREQYAKEPPGSSYLNVAIAYTNLENYDSALIYLDTAHKIIEKFQPELMDQVLEKLGQVYEKQKKYDKATLAYEEALAAAIQLEKYRVQSWILRSLSRIHIETNEQEKAIMYLDSLKLLLDQHPFVRGKIDYHLLHYEYFLKQNDRLNALEHYKIKADLEDSLYQISNAEEVVSRRNTLDLLEKENEVQLAETKQKYQRNIFLSIVVFLILFILGLSFTLKRIRLINTKLKLQKEQISYKNDQLEQKSNEIQRQIFETRKRNNELSQALRMLKNTQNRLIQSEKMASIGILTAGLAHELNNPLSHVNGAVEPLKLDFEEIKQMMAPEKVEAAALLFNEISTLLEGMKSGATKAADIIHNLMEIAPYRVSEHQQIFNLGDLLKSTTKLISKNKNSIDIMTKIEDELLIKGNRVEINQVIINLLNNALEATEKVSLGKIQVLSFRDNDEVLIQIKDNGPGITSEIKDKIFEPFFTTKDPNSGTGLGLYIAYSIIYKHEGSINFNCEPEGGTTVTVSLPADIEVLVN